MKKEVSEVVYLSTFSNTMVGFDGIAKESRHGILPFKPEHFKEGRLTLHPTKDYGNRRGLGKDIIKRMEGHPKNRVNGGNLFYQVDQNAMDVMDYQSGTLVAREPSGGLTKPIKKQLGELYVAMQEGYENHDILIDEIGVVFDTFSIKGILKPEKSHDQMRVRARLTEFFAVLEEREIWEPPAPKK